MPLIGRQRRAAPLWLAVVGVSLASLAACGGKSGDAAPPRPTGTVPVGTCKLPAGDRTTPFTDGTSVRTRTLAEGGGGAPAVHAAVYPHPDHEGNPWSQWGQGLALADGRFFSAIGDHLGKDGDSYLYEYDPKTSTLRQVADIQRVVGHQPGAWAYGKIHAQIVPGLCGELYTSTYWGSTRGITFGNGYEGDVLLRIDPGRRTVTSLGVPVAHHGVPSLAGLGKDGLLYGEAVDPSAGDGEDASKAKGNGSGGPQGSFFAYDVRSGRVVYQSDDPRHRVFRNVIVDNEGRAFFSAGENQLQRYDPDAKSLAIDDARLPGQVLRASTRPAPDGSVYGTTEQPDTIFVRRRSGKIEELGPARGYVASIALSPDARHLYYVPEAHGNSWEQGTPLIEVDTKTGDERVVVKLNDLSEKELKLRLGGSYDVAVDPSGKRVFVGANAGQGDEPFGDVVLLVVDLP